MAKSKCALCNKILKSGEWQLKKTVSGIVIKICNDRQECLARMSKNANVVSQNGGENEYPR